jgi:hypothetical protein
MTYEELLNIPHFTAESLQLSTKDGSPVPPEIVEGIRKYGLLFAAYQPTCLGCGESLCGLLLGTFEWGIQTGEGHCRKCRYPYRVMHQIPELGYMEILLGYHPDHIADMNQLKNILDELGIDEPNVPSAMALALEKP